MDKQGTGGLRVLDIFEQLDSVSFSNNGLSILVCLFSSPLPSIPHLLPPSLNFPLSSPRGLKIKIQSSLVKRKKHPIHLSGGCDWFCLSRRTKVFRKLLFLPKIDPPLVEFALLLSSWEFRSPPRRTQFNLHLFSQSFTSWYQRNDY